MMFIEEFFSSPSIPTIVKWIVTIMVTGFIAQFGKKLADYLISRFRKRREMIEIVDKDSSEIPDKYRAKMEKKARKAEIKKLKKRE